VIDGEPGIGKSRLLADLLQRAQAGGLWSLAGAGDVIETTTPYHAWRPILTQLMGLVGVDDTEERRSRVLARGRADPELGTDPAGACPGQAAAGGPGDRAADGAAARRPPSASPRPSHRAPPAGAAAPAGHPDAGVRPPRRPAAARAGRRPHRGTRPGQPVLERGAGRRPARHRADPHHRRPGCWRGAAHGPTSSSSTACWRSPTGAATRRRTPGGQRNERPA